MGKIACFNVVIVRHAHLPIKVLKNNEFMQNQELNGVHDMSYLYFNLIGDFRL